MLSGRDVWVVALAASGFLAFVVTPVAIRHRAHRPRRSALTSSAGLAAGVAVTLLFLDDADTALVVGVVAALGLWVVGSLADRERLPRTTATWALLAATVAVTIAGLRLHVTGFAAGDAVVTTIVVFAAASAWRSGLTRDGLLAGWACEIAIAAGLLGYFAGQHAITSVAAGIVGASLGFLAYWFPPSAARLRSGGSHLIGFLAVVLALDAHPALGTPRDAVIPIVLLSLPLLDTMLVSASRVRGWQVDPRVAGLAGRLHRLGVQRSGATMLLVALQFAFSALAVFAGRDVLALGIAGAAVGLGALTLVVAALGATLGEERDRTSARRLVVLGIGAVVVLAGLSVAPALALLRARNVARSAADSAEAGLAAARKGESSAAELDFSRAENDFNTAKRRLSSPLVGGGLAVPVLSPNLRAARELMDIGIDLSRAGQELTSTADPQKLRIRNGTLPLAELARLQPGLDATARTLRSANKRLHAIDRTFLVAQVDDAITKLERKLTTAAHDSRVAADAARVLPAVFGANGARHYFLAVQNNAEARANGGFIGNWGIITASDGKMTLDQFRRVAALNPTPTEVRVLHAPADYVARYARFQPEQRWQNVNSSPDLPTVGKVIADQLTQAGVGSVQGIVTVDPIGLSYVMQLTGPVTVAGWPGQITAANVVDVTLRQAYVVYANSSRQRDSFLGDVADAVWRKFTSGDLGSPANVLRVLGRASRSKHLAVWLADPGAERLVHGARAGVAMPPPGADLSLLTTQNAGQNKLDVYLHRRIRYEVHLAPNVHGGFSVGARVQVTLANSAPSSGLPLEVLGPNLEGLGPGVNRTFLTLYSPLHFFDVHLDGARSGLQSERELGYWADSSYIDLDPGSTHTLVVDLAGTVPVGSGGRYQLDLVRQALENPDDIDVAIDVASGWHLSGGRAIRVVDAHHAVYTGKLDRDLALSVRVSRDPGSSLWDRLAAG